MSDEYIKKDDLINCLKSEIEKISLPFPTTAMKWKRGGFSHAKAIVESFDTVSFSSLSDSDNKGWIPFSERQPDDGQEVIATVIADESKNLPKRVIMDCFMTVDLEWWQNNVTAWMPKPNAYENPCEVAGV